MSTLYNITVLRVDRERAYADLNIKVVHPDSMNIHETPGFALHVLRSETWKGSPISDEISNEDFTDEKWCSMYAQGFIRKAEILETIYEQPEGSKYKYDRDYSHPFWDKPHEWPEVVIRITASDVAWLEHIKDGDEWESTAYDPARVYSNCEPILRAEKSDFSEQDKNLEKGWVPFPSFLVHQGTLHLPKVLSFPAFTESAYEVVDVREVRWDDPKHFLEYHGQYVYLPDKKESGFLVWNDVAGYCDLYSFGRRSRGGNYLGLQSTPRKIGRLKLRSNYPRKSLWMEPWTLLKHAEPVIEKVEVNGNHLTLQLIGIYDIDELKLDKAKVLKMICNNYVETFQHEKEQEREFPLSRVLKFFVDIKENIYYPKQVIPLIADGIVLDYKIEYPDRLFPDFDDLEESELIAFYEDWPCFKIHITLSDETFGLQLGEAVKSRRKLQLSFMQEPIKKIDKPLLWSDFSDLV